MSHRVKLDSDSEGSIDSEEFNHQDAEDIALEDPMYYILEKYLVNEEGENIATVLTNLVKQITMLREALVSKKE
jgi:hypothetical protein